MYKYQKNKNIFKLCVIIISFYVFSLLIYFIQLNTNGSIQYAFYKSLHPGTVLLYLIFYIFIVLILKKSVIIDKIAGLWILYIYCFILINLTYLTASKTLFIYNSATFQFTNNVFYKYQNINRDLKLSGSELIPITNNHLDMVYIHFAYPQLSAIIMQLDDSTSFFDNSKKIEQYISSNVLDKNIILFDPYSILSKDINKKKYLTYKKFICQKKLTIYPEINKIKCSNINN